MAPPEQPVKIAKLLVKLAVLRGADQNCFHQTKRTFPNRVRQRANPRIGADPFAVHHAGIEKFASDPTIDIDSGGYQRPEKIAFPALIHAEMRPEHFRRMHFFVAQFRLTQNLRFQLELDELFHAAALHEHFGPLLINGHAQLAFLREENRPLLWRKLEPELFQQRAKLCCLFFRQCVSVRIQRPTLNAQGSTLNSEFDVGRWAFGVRRSAKE